MTNINKRWAVALKKNVTLELGETYHTSFSLVDTYRPYRTFTTRTEARTFKKTVKSPAVIIDTIDRVAVR